MVDALNAYPPVLFVGRISREVTNGVIPQRYSQEIFFPFHNQCRITVFAKAHT